MNKRHVSLIIVLISMASFLPFKARIINNEKQEIRLLFLKDQVTRFAQKYHHQDSIVVSKQDHLLFYFKKGKIVKNDRWNGFTYNFPVKVALAGQFYKTPEGEMFIEEKNPYSRYILFLKLSYPGAYGIHSAPTRFRAFLNKMEKIDPNYKFATLKDDTRGCVQVENRVIKYLYAQVEVKTPVLILP